jgi:hypothetical protein
MLVGSVLSVPGKGKFERMWRSVVILHCKVQSWYEDYCPQGCHANVLVDRYQSFRWTPVSDFKVSTCLSRYYQDSHQHRNFRFYHLLLWRWRHLLPVKCWYLTTKMYCITYQKSVIVIATTVPTASHVQSWYLSGSTGLNWQNLGNTCSAGFKSDMSWLSTHYCIT